MTKNIKYIHFGERCQPILIINMLLNINVKTLFQLGIYPFNSIIQILEDEMFDNIMNLEYLTYKGKKVKHLDIDKHDGYAHTNSALNNSKYKITLMHDYGIDDDNETIINYNFVQKSHKLKQRNFYEYIKSGDFLCFITILYESNISDLEYNRMNNVLKNKYCVEDFIIVIFTNDKSQIPCNLPKCFEFIILENEYRDDICRDTSYRINLYKDMWDKFRHIMKKYGYKYKNFDDQFDITRMPKLNSNNFNKSSTV